MKKTRPGPGPEFLKLKTGWFWAYWQQVKTLFFFMNKMLHGPLLECGTGKYLSEALIFAEYRENIICT